jgi:hypothetical protein
MAIICLQCGSVNKRAVGTIQGSFLLECFLWLLFILPGIIYSVWRLTTKAKVCPACSSREIVPLASPMGQKLQRELATVGSVPPSVIELPAAAEIPSRCSNCGQQSPAGSSFCGHCGTKRTASSESTHTATPPNNSIRGGRLGWRVVGLIVGIPLVVLVATLAQRQPAASIHAGHRQASVAPAPVAVHAVHPGELAIARQNSICGSSVQALDEMVKWAVRGDEREMFRVLVTTGSSMWTTGSSAKVLDVGGFLYSRTRIRILKTQRECWVPSEAVQ